MFIGLGRALVASFFLFGITLSADAAERVAEKVPGVRIFYPDTWTLGTIYQDALEIVRMGSNERVDARVLVYFEQRLDPAEAIERLGDLARPYSDKASIVVLHGWPAVVAEVQGPLPRRRPGTPQLVGTMRSVAIAAGDRIYWIETVIEQGAATGVREEASAIENRVRFSMEGNSERSQSLLPSIRTKSQTPVDIQPIRKPKSSTPPQTSTTPSATGSAGFAANLGGANGELEVAVSPTGQSIVVASNGGVFSSQDGGATFTATATGTQPTNDRGDPSVAWAGSKTFYQSRLNINQPNPAVPATACSIALGSSTDLGRTFNWGLPLIQSCGAGGAAGCFPDQPHIAATPYFSFPGPDSIYMTWRHWTNVGAPPSSCQTTNGSFTGQLICSSDGGQNWSAPRVIRGGLNDAGDFPRISAGGFIYVVFTLPNPWIRVPAPLPPIVRDVYVHKFSDCAGGLTPVPGFPRFVATLRTLACPVPGLDRCNNGNELASPTITASQVSPNRVSISFAAGNTAGGDDVLVTDSWDGGLNWSTPEVVNDNVTTRRFMPWSCEESGQIFIGYYDRRNSAGATVPNDVTDYYVTSASKFASGSPFSIAPDDRLTPFSDRQCLPTWTALPRSANDLTSCTTPPLTFTGTCTNLPGLQCQINTPAATGPAPALPAGCGACNVQGSPGFPPALGVPRYGDYNGIGCGGGLVVGAWAAGTTLTGATTPTIQIYMQTRGVRLRPSEGTNHSTSLIQREAKSSAPSNFELIVPIGNALTNFTRQNGLPGAPWKKSGAVNFGADGGARIKTAWSKPNREQLSRVWDEKSRGVGSYAAQHPELASAPGPLLPIRFRRNLVFE